MNKGRGRSRVATLVGSALLTLAGLSLLLPATGSAATKYPAPESVRTFSNPGTNGWSSESSYNGVLGGLGICELIGGLPILGGGSALCPEFTVSNPGGYLNVHGEGTLSVLTTASSTVLSPQFQYNGDDGKPADILQFGMDQKADIGGLLAGLDAGLPGGLGDILHHVSQSISIVDFDNPENEVQVVVPKKPLAEILNIDLAELLDIIGGDKEPSWQPAASEVIPSSSLKVGNWYKIKITTTYSGLAGLVGLLPAFDIGMDNITLTAIKDDPAGPGQPGGPGTPGKDGKDGKGGSDGKGGKDGKTTVTAKTLIQSVKQNLPNRVVVGRNGRWVRVPVKCPPKYNALCRFTTVAKLKRFGPAATRAKFRPVGKGKRRVQALLVKKKFRARMKKAKRIFIQQTVAVGGVKVRVIKPVRPVRR